MHPHVQQTLFWGSLGLGIALVPYLYHTVFSSAASAPVASSTPSASTPAAAPAHDLRAALDVLTSGGQLSSAEYEAIGAAVAGGRVDSHQLAGFLLAVATRGESSEALVGFARAMRAAATRVDLLGGSVQEIVGTGGDGQDTVNISTAAAVLAAACGVPMAKHGSVAVSSRSGAADVLQCLGVARLPPPAIPACLHRCGLAFMHAPLFHPAMRHAQPVRAALRVRTLFNALGPLLNPAGARFLLLGVATPALQALYAQALPHLGVQRALIVHTPLPSGGGLDELATIAPARVIEVQGSASVQEYVLDTAAWGVPQGRIEDLRGGSPAHNAAAIERVLGGGQADSHMARTIALNAGAAMYCFGAAPSIREGYTTALSVLDSGEAGKKLKEWARVSQELQGSK